MSQATRKSSSMSQDLWSQNRWYSLIAIGVVVLIVELLSCGNRGGWPPRTLPGRDGPERGDDAQADCQACGKV
jgi:hypothetical protein